MDENFCNSNTNTNSVCFSERSQKWLYKWARTAGYTRYEMHYTFMKHWKRLFCRHEVGQTKKSKATLQVLNFDPRHPDDKDIDKEAFSNLCQALRSSDPSLTILQVCYYLWQWATRYIIYSYFICPLKLCRYVLREFTGNLFCGPYWSSDAFSFPWLHTWQTVLTNHFSCLTETNLSSYNIIYMLSITLAITQEVYRNIIHQQSCCFRSRRFLLFKILLSVFQGNGAVHILWFSSSLNCLFGITIITEHM